MIQGQLFEKARRAMFDINIILILSWMVEALIKQVLRESISRFRHKLSSIRFDVQIIRFLLIDLRH